MPELEKAVQEEEQGDAKDVTQTVEKLTIIVAIGKRSAAVAAEVVTRQQLNPTPEQP